MQMNKRQKTKKKYETLKHKFIIQKIKKIWKYENEESDYLFQKIRMRRLKKITKQKFVNKKSPTKTMKNEEEQDLI